MSTRGGTLAIVLHTHMPYVHGYGTWPFGEEWLWDVFATSYLPVAAIAARAPLTVSLTPVVADQLEAPGAAARCEHFLDVVRRGTHAEDRRHMVTNPELTGIVAASDHSWAVHEAALAQVRALGGDLLAPVARVSAWTSAATHAVLPLLATEAGVRLQAGTGAASHRRRCGTWGGGFWLPECAWDPELEGALIEEGVRTVCVELAGSEGLDVTAPWALASGLRILPLDRPLIDRVWHHSGYPSAPEYRDSHRRSFQGHALWSNAGGAYEPEAGAARARADAADWARACAGRLAGRTGVVAFDTELFGHWWHEGPLFLAAAVDALAAEGVELVTADEVIARAERSGLPVADAPPPSTWGAGRDLRTWSGPAVAPIAWELRRAELELLGSREPGGVREAALRDLLALQSSDWAFMVSDERAAEYGWARFAGHRLATTQRAGSLPSSAPRLRHLAPDLAQDALAVG